MVDVDAIILASGLSRRMGEEKLLLPFGKSNVLEHFLDLFPSSHFSRTLLVTSAHIAQQLRPRETVKVVVNQQRELGKSHAIKTGLHHSRASAGVLFAVADQPLLQKETVLSLLDAFRKRPEKIIVPRANGKQRNPVIFPARLQDQFHALQGDQGGKIIIADNSHLIHFVEFDSPLQFHDIDTPEAYRRAVELEEKTTQHK